MKAHEWYDNYYCKKCKIGGEARMRSNYFDDLIKPVEKFLDENIDNGNIWFYLAGVVVIILYFLLF